MLSCRALKRPLRRSEARPRPSVARNPPARCSAQQLPVAAAPARQQIQASTLCGSLLASVLLAGGCAASGLPAAATTAVPQQELQQQGPSPAAPASVQQAPAVRAPGLVISIVHLVDSLSLATDNLIDLTAAAEGGSLDAPLGPYAGSGGGGGGGGGQYVTASASLAGTPAPPQLAADMADAGGVPPGEQLLQGGAAHRLSQQALAVAGEALKLATLLEGQCEEAGAGGGSAGAAAAAAAAGGGPGGVGVGAADPSELALLQQIAEAARLVSVIAADIVQPLGPEGDAAAPALTGQGGVQGLQRGSAAPACSVAVSEGSLASDCVSL